MAESMIEGKAIVEKKQMNEGMKEERMGEKNEQKKWKMKKESKEKNKIDLRKQAFDSLFQRRNSLASCEAFNYLQKIS